MLDFTAFSIENRRRCESIEGFSHWIGSWSASDWMVAMTGELGEAANVLKKLNRVRDGIVGNKETPEELEEALAKELADCFIYLDLLCQAKNIDLAAEVIKKFNETSRKIGYPYTL